MEKMSWIVSSQDVESLALQSYSRKEKSLGVLVSKYCFTSLSLDTFPPVQIWGFCVTLKLSNVCVYNPQFHEAI